MMRNRRKPSHNGAAAGMIGVAPHARSRRIEPPHIDDGTHLDLEGYLPFLINRVGEALVDRFSKDALATQGLSIGMWRVLAALSEKGVQRQIDLVTATSIEASTLSRLVTRLVRMRLVTRQRSQTSNREVLIQLTQQGARLLETLIPVAQSLHDDAIRGISRKQQALLVHLLRTMYLNVVHSPRRKTATRRRPASSGAATRRPEPT